jgi:hypothetical protein
MFIYLFIYLIIFLQFCGVTKVVMIHVKILAKFHYKLNLKAEFLKQLSIFFGYICKPCIKFWQMFLLLGQILAIENLKRALDFNNFNY